MKREEIKNLIPDIAKEALDSIMAINGRDIEAAKASVTALTTERDSLKTQLDEARSTIQSYQDMDIDGIRQSAADWESKYNKDTQALRDQLAAVEYGHAVEAAVAGMKFTSASARKAFLADLTEKKLPLQEGKLLGLDDFAKTYRETDPGAFVPEGDDKTPVITRGTGGTGGGGPVTMKDAIAAALKK